MTKFSLSILVMLGFLTACHNTNVKNKPDNEQAILRKVVENTMGAYTIASEAMLPFIDGDIPGVKLTQKEKELIQAASATVYSNLDVLDTAIQHNQTLSEIAVESAVVQLKMLNTCWFQLKDNSHRTAVCKAIVNTQPTSNVKQGTK